MADPNSSITLYAAGVGALASIIGALAGAGGAVWAQHLASARDLAARKEERLSRNEDHQRRFQARTLMKVQAQAMDLVSNAVSSLGLRRKLKGLHGHPQYNEVLEDYNKCNVRAWEIGRQFALMRERLKDDELREKLKALNKKVGEYVASNRDFDESELRAAMEAMDASFQDANNCLGPILRRLS